MFQLLSGPNLCYAIRFSSLINIYTRALSLKNKRTNKGQNACKTEVFSAMLYIWCPVSSMLHVHELPVSVVLTVALFELTDALGSNVLSNSLLRQLKYARLGNMTSYWSCNFLLEFHNLSDNWGGRNQAPCPSTQPALTLLLTLNNASDCPPHQFCLYITEIPQDEVQVREYISVYANNCRFISVCIFCERLCTFICSFSSLIWSDWQKKNELSSFLLYQLLISVFNFDRVSRKWLLHRTRNGLEC